MSQNVKTQIKQYIEGRRNHIEEFIEQIHSQMEKLTSTRSEIRHLLADCHVTELVQLRDERLMKLIEVNDTKLQPCSWPKTILTYKGILFIFDSVVWRIKSEYMKSLVQRSTSLHQSSTLVVSRLTMHGW